MRTNHSFRAEGIHSLIKAHIKISTLDLFDVWQAIKPALTNQIKELSYVRADQQLRTPLDISGVLFEAVRGWVSYPALRKVQEQQQLLSKPLHTICTRTFTSSYGLPCAHTLKKLEGEGRPLLLEHFHPHWHLRREAAQPQPLLEPRAASRQRAQIRNQPIASVRREPSGFEAVEAATRPRKQPTCSRCHTLGHTMASKACLLRFQELLQVSGSEALADPSDEREAPILAPPPSEITAIQVTAGQLDVGQVAAFQTPTGHSEADQTVAPQEPPGDVSTSQVSSDQESEDCIVVDQTAEGQTLAVPVVAAQAEGSAVALVPELRYDDPRAIYQAYVAEREAWYKAQPRGSIKTNQQYRKAIGLPQRYSKTDYHWCLDWKQMGKDCKMQGGSREWTREEMMAYLDWSKAEDDRVDAEVATEMEGNMFSGRRGMGDIWEAAARDSRAREAFYIGK